jgi:putative ABC transport system substrate-binding protein
VILAHGSSTLGALQQATRTIPIVFPVAGDPVAGGFIESLARPGGNITGFSLFEFVSARNGSNCSSKLRPA